jgi:chemotaxis protein CheX
MDLIGQEALIDILHKVTGEVLSTMLNLCAHPEPAYTDHQPAQSSGVLSFVGLAGGACAGTGSLHCDSTVACQLASRFLMSEFDSVDDEVLDAFGELTNMIVGNFKNEIERYLGTMALSIPTVVYGRNFSTRSPGHEEWTVVPFMWDDSLLNVRVSFSERKTGPSQSHARSGGQQEFILSR